MNEKFIILYLKCVLLVANWLLTEIINRKNIVTYSRWVTCMLLILLTHQMKSDKTIPENIERPYFLNSGLTLSRLHSLKKSGLQYFSEKITKQLQNSLICICNISANIFSKNSIGNLLQKSTSEFTLAFSGQIIIAFTTK